MCISVLGICRWMSVCECAFSICVVKAREEEAEELAEKKEKQWHRSEALGEGRERGRKKKGGESDITSRGYAVAVRYSPSVPTRTSKSAFSAW